MEQLLREKKVSLNKIIQSNAVLEDYVTHLKGHISVEQREIERNREALRRIVKLTEYKSDPLMQIIYGIALEELHRPPERMGG